MYFLLDYKIVVLTDNVTNLDRDYLHSNFYLLFAP